ncbi:glycosyltransferase family 4 protein [Staphylococcus chromogenes]|nr:glycosyltransferase family 4 protein [Staphylococcus chromogenes]
MGIVCPYSFDEPGGVQAHILDLAEYLRSKGHETSVIGPATDRAHVPSYVVRGGPAVAVAYNGSVARLSFGPRIGRLLRQFIEEGNFDVLHIHEPNAPGFSMQALSLAEGPIVATYHASASTSRLLKLASPSLRPMLEKIRGGIAVSEMARRWQVEQLGGDPVLIPNGVNVGIFQRACQPRSANGPVHIAFLGRIDEPRKGLPILLQALNQMQQRDNCVVTVMGSGTGVVHPGVRYVGRVSDAEKAAILGRADIYVAPNTGGESFGIVLVEAMAAGCAVVASDLEAFQDVLQTRSASPAGLVFRNSDPTDLARALDLLVSFPAVRERLQHVGRTACERYDWEHVGAEIVRVYETVAQGPVRLKKRS